jgi:hypothetical protein
MSNKLQILLWVVIFFVGVMLSWTLRLEAGDNKTVILREWTTQIIYDTTNACYEGTIKWIVLSNPSLFGQMPNYQSQRQMIVHCFCVMDKIRKEFKMEEYQKLVYDPEWVGNLFMTRAMECVKEQKTLPSFFTTQAGEEDNKTITTPEGKPEDSQELLPNQQEEELEGLPETIFQG